MFKKKFDAEETLRMVETEKLTILSGSPAVFRRIARSKSFPVTDFSSIRMIRCGAAAPSIDLMESYWAKGLFFYNGYGTTEAGFGILSLPAHSMNKQQVRDKAGSTGKQMLFSEVKLVDEDGCEMPCGEKGEVITRGMLLFSGYWKNEAETRHVMQDGWFYTGDIAFKDEDGFYYLCGRKKNMFISGGENIYPVEIENVILSHPMVEDVCVIGVEDTEWGEVGKAIVVLKNNTAVNQDDLKEFLKSRISTIKYPKYFEFVAEIPRNDAGKTLTQVVYEQYSEVSQ